MPTHDPRREPTFLPWTDSGGRVQWAGGPVHRVELHDDSGGGLRAVHVRFDGAPAGPDRFQAAGIALPDTVARSVPKRQAEFFHGRLAAHLALVAGGLPSTDIPVGAARQPLWPDGVLGSITHAGMVAMASVRRRDALHGLGIDLESLIGPEAEQAMVPTVFEAGEDEALVDAFGGDARLARTVGFSAKETFYKATFGTVGYVFGFEAVAIYSVDTNARVVRVRVREALAAGLPRGRSLRVFYECLPDASVLTWMVW